MQFLPSSLDSAYNKHCDLTTSIFKNHAATHKVFESWLLVKPTVFTAELEQIANTT